MRSNSNWLGRDSSTFLLQQTTRKGNVLEYLGNRSKPSTVLLEKQKQKPLDRALRVYFQKLALSPLDTGTGVF